MGLSDGVGLQGGLVRLQTNCPLPRLKYGEGGLLCEDALTLLSSLGYNIGVVRTLP